MIKKFGLIIAVLSLLNTSVYAKFQLKDLFLKKKQTFTYTYPVPEITFSIALAVQPAELGDLLDLDARLDLDEDSGGDDIIPTADLYEIWNNLQVNPYKIPADSILGNDTVYLSLKGFAYPLAKHYRVTSEFGPRRRRFHNGVDLKVFKGDSILSSMDGVVRIAKRVGGYGNLVAIRHYNGLETFYGHLSKLLVKPDQAVKSGELIGYGGSTGRSTGSHLHFEMRYMGQCLNPRDLIDFDSLTVIGDTIVLTQKHFAHVKNMKKSASGSQISSNGSNAWVVRKGDTLSLIARSTRTSISHLCAVNGITTRTVIKPGRRLKY